MYLPMVGIELYALAEFGKPASDQLIRLLRGQDAVIDIMPVERVQVLVGTAGRDVFQRAVVGNEHEPEAL